MITLPTQAAVVAATPTAEARFYRNVPWDNTYRHVRLYADSADLLAHLSQWEMHIPNYTIDNAAPIRLGIGAIDIRVPVNDARAYAINYVALRNPGSYNAHWIFCFVKEIQWLSKNSTRLVLEPDIWQNNIHNIILSPCFIERSHVSHIDDQHLGAYLVPDNIETGEPVTAAYQFWDLTPDKIVLYASANYDGSTDGYEGHLINNIYVSGKAQVFAATDAGVAELNAILKRYVDNNKQDAVLALFMCPQICTDYQAGIIHSVSIGLPTDFEGYVPKNKKLFTYPYAYVYAENHEGNTAEFKFELSDRPYHDIFLKGFGTLATTPQVVIMPQEYRGAPTDKFEYDESLVLSAFPICAWGSDTFRAYVAQNFSNLALNGVAQLLTIGAGLYLAAHGMPAPLMSAVGTTAAAVAGASGAAMVSSGVAQVAGTISTMMDIKRKPPTMHGSTSTQNINAATRTIGYHFYTRTVKREFAEVIDKYWTMYGYPIHKVDTPNITNRPAWNYIKTIDCPFRPTSGAVMPTGDLAKLHAIFDAGVTVWHTDEVGNYGLENE